MERDPLRMEKGKQGSGRMLSESQESAVWQIICDKRPEQLKMEFALWNRAAVMQLIELECRIKLSARGVGNYLKRWGSHPAKADQEGLRAASRGRARLAG